MPTQYLYPVSQIRDSINTWYNSDGGSGNAYLRINEGTASPDDGDYVYYNTGSVLSPRLSVGRLLVVPISTKVTTRTSGVCTFSSIKLYDTNTT